MHSYIIVSDSASGKKLADSIAPYQIKKSIDNLIIKSETKIGINAVREIKLFLSKKPYQNSHKIILIYQADLLTLQAQNSFLKTIEEPPSNSLIFLITTNIDKLLPTVISRCQIIKDKTSIKPTSQTTLEFDKIFNTLKKSGIGQKISLADQYAYPKTKAISLCQNAIFYFKEILENQPSYSTSQNLKLAHQTLNRLESNIDPKLSLEHLFLHLKD